MRTGRIRPYLLLLLLAAGLAFPSACANATPEFAGTEPITISLTADGQTRELTTEAGNVRALLSEVGLTFSETDLIDPPLFTPLTDGLAVEVIRVSESIEVIEQSVPFQRKTVRNESMAGDDPPIIIQGGQAGLQEITVRIVYHDGLEFSRQETQLAVVKPAQDEIVMIGVGAAPGNVEFAGLLAYVSGGNSVILRGSSTFPEQLNTGGGLDHRVFLLSPSGSHLLYTRAISDTEAFNSLWVVGTGRSDEPYPLGVENVLWAAWDPSRVGIGAGSRQRIAYTTGVPTELLPGWEANNDLWLGEVPSGVGGEPLVDFDPEQLVEAYPATYGWWGGNYAWSPTGRYLAYSHADEVGIIDTAVANENNQRNQLQSFTEYNTRAEWVWVPSLTWSPDGHYIAFTQHAGDDPDGTLFDTWAIDVASAVGGRFAVQTGIWSHPQWSPVAPEQTDTVESASQIAFLRATNPLDSLRSNYTLWLMDRDGSNARQIYPPAGENSRFPREQQYMAWGPTGRDIAFVFNDALYLLSLDTGEAHRITENNSLVSSPSWAPYGAAVSSDLETTETVPSASPTPSRGGDLPFP